MNLYPRLVRQAAAIAGRIAGSPHELGLSDDSRKLGLALRSLEFK